MGFNSGFNGLSNPMDCSSSWESEVVRRVKLVYAFYCTSGSLLPLTFTLHRTCHVHILTSSHPTSSGSVLIISPSTSVSLHLSVPLSFTHKTWYRPKINISHMCATCRVHHIFLNNSIVGEPLSFVPDFVSSTAQKACIRHDNPWQLRLLSVLDAFCADYILWKGARGGAVGWGTALQAGRSRGRFPIVQSIFHWHYPPSRYIALGLTQSLTEMSTRNISWG